MIHPRAAAPPRTRSTRAWVEAFTPLGLIVLLSACGDAPDRHAFALSDSAGVVMARNLAPAADTARAGEPAVRIGLVDGAPEYLFELVSDVQPLPGGEVVVVDNPGGRVALFDGEGRWLRDIGRRGDGPGEYRTPLHVWLAGDELLLWDMVPRRLSRYTLAGDFVDSETLAWKRTPAPLHVLGGSWVDEREWGQYTEPGPAAGALVRVSPDGAVMDTLVGPYPVPRIGWEMVDEATNRFAMVNPPTFSAYPVWAVDDQRHVWSPGGQGRVEVRDPSGRLTRVILLDRGDRPVTGADRQAHVAGMQARFGFPDEVAAQMLEGTVFTERRPAITALLTDDEGRLWVADHDPAALSRHPAREWDVLSLEGRVERRVVFPPGFKLVRVSGGRAYGISTIEGDIHVVDVFSLP
jgi:hypothetical protein